MIKAECSDGICAILYLYDVSFGCSEPRPTGDVNADGLKIRVSSSLKRESGHKSHRGKVRREMLEEVGLGHGQPSAPAF